MKALLSLAVSLGLVSVSTAGIVGWFTADARPWSFVQQTGGIRILTPIKRNGRLFLPVEYCVQGTTAITCQPTLLNSGLAVRTIEVKQRDTRLVIRVVTQVVEKGSDTARIHYVDLSALQSGVYEVYYEAAGDPTKLLGNVEIK